MFIKEELNAYRAYSLKIEEFLQASLEGKENEFEKQTADIDDDASFSIYVKEYGNEINRLEDVFPNLLRVTLFIKCFSFLEVELFSLANKLKKELDLSLSINDLQGSSIRKAQNYLKNVANIEFPDNDESWHEIKKYNILRNYLVHDGLGFPITMEELDSNVSKIGITGKTKELINIINQHPLLSLEESLVDYLELRLSREFCNEVVDKLMRFFTIIYNTLLNCEWVIEEDKNF